MITIKSEDDGIGLAFATDMIYCRHGDTDLKLHLVTPGLMITPSGYEPKGNPIPLIVYVPGSAWFPQNLERSVPHMIDFARQTGYAITIVAYRPSTIARSPAQLVDVKASIRFMRANAARYNIDPDRIAIWGTSSGGHMASLVGLTQGIEKFDSEEHANESSEVKAVVDFFGPTNFLKMADFPSDMDHNAPTSPESVVVGGPIQDPKNRAKVEEYNPITYVSADRKSPPFLIIHGDKDNLVPFNQSELLYEALRDANQDVTFYKLEGAGHGTRFFTPTPLKIVQEFLDEHLNGS